MSRFVPTTMLTDDERREVSEMTGKIILWMLEGRTVKYMSEQLGLSPRDVVHNVYETLYTIRKQVGRRNYLKVLFWK